MDLYTPFDSAANGYQTRNVADCRYPHSPIAVLRFHPDKVKCVLKASVKNVNNLTKRTTKEPGYQNRLHYRYQNGSVFHQSPAKKYYLRKILNLISPPHAFHLSHHLNPAKRYRPLNNGVLCDMTLMSSMPIKSLINP